MLCARADQGFMAKITSNSFGGIMARRLLPATLLIPIVLGWLQHRGQRAGLYTMEPGLAFFAVANVIVFISVVWWGVCSLHRMDTKRREAEHGLKETAAKLARSNADLEQFAYVASHDLKEPLRAISGSVQILQEQYKHQLGGEADEMIKHTVDGATRMQKLIDDLLTYSRLTTREAPFQPTDCSLLLQEVLSNLETAINESKAVVTLDPLPTVNADRTQLLQVFQNLIANGIKYRSERTPKIHVSAEENEHEWIFSVHDNGIGIAPQYADRIFRIFQRLHTRKEYVGTGIGLAVSKKIVERHGGRIWVDSEPEEGSTFFFTIPK
jgi:light-regulated signal transduction histidine kinase (bacteriophytochrome)